MTNSELSVELTAEIVTKDEYEQFSTFDADRVGKIISIAPMIIGRAENRIAQLEQERFRLHQEFKKKKASARIKARRLKGEEKLRNESDVEDHALLDPSVIETMNAEIECVTKLKQTKVIHEYWRNQFIAARKLETRITQQNELELQAARYTT